jgi:signal transduction histidine kinase
MRNNSSFEPGIFEVFRLFIAIRLVLSLISLVLSIWPINPRFAEFQGAPMIGVIETAILFGYLSWPWLRHRLGKLYLPIALGVATIMPFVENIVGVDTRQANEVVQIRAVAAEWQLVIMLLIPLILVSWQYSFRVLVWYCLALVVLDGISISIYLASNAGSIREVGVAGVSLFRTMIFVFVGYVINRLAAGQRQQNARLAQANQQLASYANALEQLTISRERNRLAREFHDTLAHTLSAVAVQLEAVNTLWQPDPAKAHSMLVDSLTATRTGLNESRRAIQSLRATPLEDMGLSLAIKQMARSVAERNGLILDLQFPDEIVGIGPDNEQNIYRIAEETLHNVTQHARAKHVWVDLVRADHKLTLTIRDDGLGFNLDNAIIADRFGLRGMRERAEAIGAQILIESQPDQGTTVQLVMETKNGTSSNL